MIILAGEADWQDKVKQMLAQQGYIEETLLVNLHAQGMFPTAPAANQNQLLDWLMNRPALEIEDFIAEMDKTPTSGNEWRARIAGRNETVGETWYIHDYRPFWFLGSFTKAAAGRVKIIALIAEDNEYQAAIKRFLDKRLPGMVEMPVLKLTKPPSKAQLDKFLTQSGPVSINDIPTLNEIAGEGK